MEKGREFTEKDESDLLQAVELATTYLSEDDKNILKQIDEQKDKLEDKLGRPLNDEEAENIERGVEGGWNTIGKLIDLIPVALTQIRSDGLDKIQ